MQCTMTYYYPAIPGGFQMCKCGSQRTGSRDKVNCEGVLTTFCHGSPCQKGSVHSEFQPGGQWTTKPFVLRLHTHRPQPLYTVYAVSLRFLHLDSSPGEFKNFFFFLNCRPKEFNLLRSVIDQTSRQFKRCTWFQAEHRKIYQTQFSPVKNRTEVHFMASYCETASDGQKPQGLVKQS